jgi:hypothetical protein
MAIRTSVTFTSIVERPPSPLPSLVLPSIPTSAARSVRSSSQSISSSANREDLRHLSCDRRREACAMESLVWMVVGIAIVAIAWIAYDRWENGR